MSTCNQPVGLAKLQTLGSQLLKPKNLPDHWSGLASGEAATM